MSHIYISHRSVDSSRNEVRQIREKLIDTFGEDSVYDSAGNHMETTLERQAMVESCDALLIVIGRYWLNMVDEQGQILLEDPYDPVHIEISAGLQSERFIRVLLVDSTTKPTRQEMPEVLRWLVNQDMVQVSTEEELEVFLDDFIRMVESPQNRFKTTAVMGASQQQLTPRQSQHTLSDNRYVPPSLRHTTPDVQSELDPDIRKSRWYVIFGIMIVIGLFSFIMSFSDYPDDQSDSTVEALKNNVRGTAQADQTQSYLDEINVSVTRIFLLATSLNETEKNAATDVVGEPRTLETTIAKVQQTAQADQTQSYVDELNTSPTSSPSTVPTLSEEERNLQLTLTPSSPSSVPTLSEEERNLQLTLTPIPVLRGIDNNQQRQIVESGTERVIKSLLTQSEMVATTVAKVQSPTDEVQPTSTLQVSDENSPAITFEFQFAYEYPVTDIGFHPRDNNRLFTYELKDDNRIWLLDLDNESNHPYFHTGDSRLVFWYAIERETTTVEMYDDDDPKIRGMFDLIDYIKDVNSGFIIVMAEGNVLYLLDTDTLDIISSYQLTHRQERELDFFTKDDIMIYDSFNNRLMIVTDNNTIATWSIKDTVIFLGYAEFPSNIEQIAVNADGTSLAIRTDDAVEVYKIRS